MSSDTKATYMAEWRSYSLAQIALNGKEGFVDGPFGSALPASLYQPSGIPVIRGSNLSKGQERFRDGEFVYVSRDTSSRLARANCVADDLIFTKKGTLGQVGIIPRGKYPLYLLSSNQMRLRVDLDVAHPEFVYYYLAQEESISKIIRDSEHTGVPKINLAYLREFPIALPSIKAQTEIVLVLRTLDDRITLLRETNATLEAIAQALFKSWFVDFDPVRAKAEGLEPQAMDAPTAALFPDSFEDSELGLVPKGWAIKTLQDLLVLQRGFDLPASTRTAGAYPIIAASGPSGTHHEAMAKGPGVVTGRSGILGRVFLELEDYWPLNTTLWVKEFRAATPCYAYELLRLIDFSSFNAGSAVPSLNRNHVHGLKYLIPDKACIEAFEAIALPIHQRAQANEKQAQTLTHLRDTLLPRLISGQLRLPQAEALISAVGA